MSAEEWKTIPGYSFYEVSDQGRVRSYRNNRWGRTDTPRVLSLSPWIPSRYCLTTYQRAQIVSDQGVKRYRPVHQLVLAAFVGPRPEGMVSRHLNGDGSDNRLINLRYGTQAENSRDRVEHGRHACAARTHCPLGHPYAGENLKFTRRGARRCRECSRLQSIASRARLKESRAAA